MSFKNINISKENVNCVLENNFLNYYIDLDFMSENFKFFNKYKNYKYNKLPYSSELLYFMFMIKNDSIENVCEIIKMFDYYKVLIHVVDHYLANINNHIIFSVYNLLDKNIYKHALKCLEKIILNRILNINNDDIRNSNIIKYNLKFINKDKYSKVYYCDCCDYYTIFDKKNFKEFEKYKNSIIDFLIVDKYFVISIDVNYLFKYFKYFIQNINDIKISYGFELLVMLANYINTNNERIINTVKKIYLSKDCLIESYLSNVD